MTRLVYIRAGRRQALDLNYIHFFIKAFDKFIYLLCQDELCYQKLFSHFAFSVRRDMRHEGFVIYAIKPPRIINTCKKNKKILPITLIMFY